ncbi:probable aspartyl aminopeptidase [Tanacetum coccineum]
MFRSCCRVPYLAREELEVKHSPVMERKTSIKMLMFDATVSEKSLEDESGVRMVALFDHEEVGSSLAQGAGSLVMFDALNRITTLFSSNPQLLEKAIQKSFLVSADMAHALHPNNMDKHKENRQPRLRDVAVYYHFAISTFPVKIVIRSSAFILEYLLQLPISMFISDDNLADPFTKALAFLKHSEHTKNIGMLPASSLM